MHKNNLEELSGMEIPSERPQKVCVCLEEEEKKSKMDKIIWYDFHDEHSKRDYEVGFHISGDLVGYCTSESTKNECLRQMVPSESCEHYEEYRIDRKCDLVKKSEQDSF